MFQEPQSPIHDRKPSYSWPDIKEEDLFQCPNCNEWFPRWYYNTIYSNCSNCDDFIDQSTQGSVWNDHRNYDDYIIKQTSVWGHYYKAKSNLNRLRLMKKNKLIHSNGYPFIDHFKIYAFKPKSQKGPAKESQTFIISFAYNYDSFIGDKEIEFIDKLKDINLSFYKEKCVFSGKDAYKILIMDSDVNLNEVLKHISHISHE